MSLTVAQAMGNQQQQQRPGGVATGHVPQQPNLGLGPNRYVPPTFNWGRGGLDGRQPQYTQMDWNQMQGFYMPQQQNNTFTNPYMQQLQGMLGMFSNQYGGPNRQPTLPQFSSYNPGFGGPTSFYDQSLQDWGRSAMGMQRNMGRGPQGQGGGSYDDYVNNFRPEQTPPGMMRDMSIQRGRDMPFSREEWEASQGMREWPMPEGFVPGGFGPEVPMNPDGRPGGWDNPIGGGGGYPGGGMQNPEGYSDRWSLAPSEMRGGSSYGFMETIGGGGGLPPGYSYDAPGDRGYTREMPPNGGRWAYGPNGERIEVGGSSRGSGADYFRNLFGDGGGMYGREYDRRAAYEHARQQPDFDWENYGESMDGPRMPYGSNGGGFGGRGGYPMMPQFNPYMLARNNMMGMGFNEMFDPRFAMLFGMGGLGAMRPQGFAATQPQQPPSTANGQKPLAIGGGG